MGSRKERKLIRQKRKNKISEPRGNAKSKQSTSSTRTFRKKGRLGAGEGIRENTERPYTKRRSGVPTCGGRRVDEDPTGNTKYCRDGIEDISKGLWTQGSEDCVSKREI